MVAVTVTWRHPVSEVVGGELQPYYSKYKELL